MTTPRLLFPSLGKPGFQLPTIDFEQTFTPSINDVMSRWFEGTPPNLSILQQNTYSSPRVSSSFPAPPPSRNFSLNDFQTPAPNSEPQPSTSGLAPQLDPLSSASEESTYISETPPSTTDDIPQLSSNLSGSNETLHDISQISEDSISEIPTSSASEIAAMGEEAGAAASSAPSALSGVTSSLGLLAGVGFAANILTTTIHGLSTGYYENQLGLASQRLGSDIMSGSHGYMTGQAGYEAYAAKSFASQQSDIKNFATGAESVSGPFGAIVSGVYSSFHTDLSPPTGYTVSGNSGQQVNPATDAESTSDINQ